MSDTTLNGLPKDTKIDLKYMQKHLKEWVTLRAGKKIKPTAEEKNPTYELALTIFTP